MNLIAFVLAIVAGAFFVLEAFGRSRFNLAALGLAVLTAAWIVQLVSTSHSIHT